MNRKVKKWKKAVGKENESAEQKLANAHVFDGLLLDGCYDYP